MSEQNAITASSDMNKYENLFHLVRSAIVSQLQSDLQSLRDALPALYSLIDRAEWRCHEQCVAEPLTELKDTVYDAEDLLDKFSWYELKSAVEGHPFIDFSRSIMHGSFNKVADIQERVCSLSGQLEKMGLHEATLQFDKLFRVQGKKLQGDDVLQLENDLQCLMNTMPTMYHLIDRAEWRCHETYVAELLQKLKDAVYDAEDLLGEFRWYELKVSVEGKATQLSPFIKFFHRVTQGNFNKVTVIQRRLSNLSSQLEKMGLQDATPWFDKSVRPVTTSFRTEPKIFGRENEMTKVVSLLGVPNCISKSSSKRKRAGNAANNEPRIALVPVLPIVGIGGVGKTALAQKITELQIVESHFDKIIWICVSDNCDALQLTKEAIQAFGGKTTTNNLDQLHNLDQLQRVLADMMKHKRYLIVLDDMWDDAFKENEQCWKTFYAPFTNALQGSTILVTTRSPKVAHLVCTMEPFQLEGLKDDVFWHFFKQCVFGFDMSNIDPELERTGKAILTKLNGSPLAAKTLGRLLAMSYDPRHWNNILSELWKHSQEATGILPALWLSYIYLPLHLKRCFSFCALYPKYHEIDKDKLSEIWVAEGFVLPQGNIPLPDIGSQYFQDLVGRSFFQEVRGKYVIHDLMHDMAQLVSKDECFIIKNTKDFLNVPQNVRHLSILKSSNVKFSNLSSLCKHRKLRTIFCNKSLMIKDGDSVMERWCTELWCLRVIFCSSINELPTNIGNLKHLRYLEVSKSGPYMNLPSTFCHLYNLETLYAKKSEFGTLPGGFDKLISLQKFETLTYQYHRDARLQVGATSGQGKKLIFSGYAGEFLPSWLLPQSFPDLTSLVLKECKELKRIQNEAFLSLTDLTIEQCNNLSSLEQFLRRDYMPVIKNIVISNCQNLESLSTENFGDFRFLEELKVCNCPKLDSGCLFAPSLKRLELENCGNLGASIECSSLTILKLSRSHLASIELRKWNLPGLQELKIIHCLLLSVIRESELISTDIAHIEARSRDEKFPNLTHLTIDYCNRLESIDDQLLKLPCIQSIYICLCPLLSLPTQIFQSFPFLKDLHLSCCRRLSWQMGMVLPLSLRRLHLEACGDFSSWFPRCLENLAALELLHICSCEGIVYIPSQMWINNLASLQELQLSDCHDLERIGGLNAIANIRKVIIFGCPKLREISPQPMRRDN